MKDREIQIVNNKYKEKQRCIKMNALKSMYQYLLKTGVRAKLSLSKLN